MKLKTLNLMVLLVTILALSPTYLIFAQSGTQPYFMGGVQQPYSYMVYKEGSYYYAKNSYGLVEYSNTNLTYVINQVNAILSSEKGVIHFCKGLYTQKIVVASNIVYQGEYEGTLFRASSSNTRLIQGDNVENVIVRNLKVDGQKGTYNYTYGIYFNNSAFITVENIEAYQCRMGVFIEFSTNCIVQNSISYDNTYYNFQYKQQQNSTFLNLISYNSGYMGISLEVNCHHNKILYCDSHSNDKAGFGGWQNCDHNLISGCYAYNNGEHGMYYANDNPATMAQHNIVSNCHFSYNTYAGIHYWAGSSNIFTGNVIVNSGTYGILVESGGTRGISHDNTFSNNLIINSGQQGIYAYGTSTEYATQNKAVGNTILNPKGDGIQFEYQNYFVVSNNDIDMTGCNEDQEGIRLLTRCRNGTVVGNTILNSDGHGICLTSWGINVVIEANQITNAGASGIAVYGTVFNCSIMGNRIQGSTDYDLYFHSNSDGHFVACNYVTSIYIDHSTSNCDDNRFFGNRVTDLSQTGSGSGNTFVDNYPDNTP